MNTDTTLTPDRGRSAEGACYAIRGRCVEIGDDDEGTPCIIIHTTREEIMRFTGSILYSDVSVSVESHNRILSSDAQ